MVSGLGSILQLGYASISMVVFTKNLASIIKASYQFIGRLFKRIGKFLFSLPLIRLLPWLLDRLRTESASIVTNNSSLYSRLVLLFRVLTAACIFGLLYIKKQIKEENNQEIEQLTVELQREEATL
jgi:hypothetical protein